MNNKYYFSINLLPFLTRYVSVMVNFFTHPLTTALNGPCRFMHPSAIIFYLRTQPPSCHQRILPTYENSLGVLRSPKMGSGFRGCGKGTSWCFIIHASLRYMSPVNPRSCGFPRRILPSRMRSFAMRRPHFMRRGNELPRWALWWIYERSSPRSGGKVVS